MSWLFAFLHHLAAFSLVAAVVVEFILIRDELTVARARKIQLADLAFGVAAGVILVVGGLRVFFFEKGSAFYFHSVPFIAKMALFLGVGLLSIYPTVEFLSWRKSVDQGRVPTVNASKIQTIRRLIHYELAAIVLLILCAALMAKGVGILG